jgi:hemolysin activation/secretion protein
MANISTDLANTILYRDRIRALRLSGNMNFTDDWQGVSSGGLMLSRGLDFLGAKETGSANLSRTNGNSDFTKLTANISRLQQVGPSWQVYAAAAGQYSASPLLASEEFGYGGQVFGRGYDQSEIAGDSGVAAGVEFRYNAIPEWERVIIQPFAFYDIGKAWKDNGGGSTTMVSAASSGAGVRFVRDSLSGSVTAAFPLTKAPTTPPPYTSDQGARLLFQVNSRF